MTPRVGVIVFKACSGVNRSSLCRIFSVSFSPRSFFAYFSEGSYVRTQLICQDRLTERPIVDLFRRDGKNRDQSGHNFKHLSHYRSGRRVDPGINPDSSQDTFSAVKKVYKSVTVCAIASRIAFGRLADPNIRTEISQLGLIVKIIVLTARRRLIAAKTSCKDRGA
jgi:hypothetical protein